MIHQPTLPYCGLTIILDKPSRFDTEKLISGWVSNSFDNFLHPIVREECEIRTLDEQSSLLPDTKVILGLGEGCIGVLASKDSSLNEIRGYPLSYQGRNLILSYAPQDAYDRRDYEAEEDDSETADNEGAIKGHGKTRRRNWRWWLMQDIRRALKLLREDVAFPNPDWPIKYVPPDEVQLDILINILKIGKGAELYLDIETDKNKCLTCLGLGWTREGGHQYVYVIPWKTYAGNTYYSADLYRRFIQALTVAMHNNTVVLHNSMFDLFILCYFYKIPFPPKVFDTMLSWHRCYPELEKSLGHLLSYLIWLPYHKSEGIYNPRNLAEDKQLWNYNAKDIIAMMELKPALEAEIARLDVQKSVDFVNSMVRPYLTMMYHGMKINIPKMLDRFTELDFKKTQLDRCLNIVAGHDLNPRSPKQVRDYLYQERGLECLNDKAPTNEKTLLKLLTKHEETIPSVRIILENRGTGKTASALKFNLYDRTTGNYNRLTCAYGLANTDTFRLASRALLKFKEDKGFGTNCQNWDKKQRDLIEADEGKLLLQADQAGAEALIVAYLCANGNFRALFLNGIKSHVFVGLHVFKNAWKKRVKYPGMLDILCTLNPKNLKIHPYFKEVELLIKDSDNWEAKERYYFIAKMICHASNYGMKAPTFQMNVLQKSDGAVALSLQECKMFLGLYHSLFPEIEQWHAHIRKQLEQTRVLKNLFGEARRFMEPTGEDLFKQGYAFIPQSTVGEITNRAVVFLQNQLDNGGYRDNMKLDLLQNGHDSILAQCCPAYSAEACDMLKRSLEQDLVAPDGTRFKMRAEVSVGGNWGPYNEKKNPSGLKEVKYG